MSRGRIRVEPEAEAELQAAAEWYEGQRAGLGHDLLEAAAAAYHRIAEGEHGTPVPGAKSAARRVPISRIHRARRRDGDSRLFPRAPPAELLAWPGAQVLTPLGTVSVAVGLRRRRSPRGARRAACGPSAGSGRCWRRWCTSLGPSRLVEPDPHHRDWPVPRRPPACAGRLPEQPVQRRTGPPLVPSCPEGAAWRS